MVKLNTDGATKIPKYQNTKIQKYKNTKIQKYKNTKIYLEYKIQILEGSLATDYY